MPTHCGGVTTACDDSRSRSLNSSRGMGGVGGGKVAGHSFYNIGNNDFCVSIAENGRQVVKIGES